MHRTITTILLALCIASCSLAQVGYAPGRGADGAAGATGPTGPTGATGATGPTGPAPSGTDNRVVRMDGTSAVQDSAVTITDTADIQTTGKIQITNTADSVSLCFDGATCNNGVGFPSSVMKLWGGGINVLTLDPAEAQFNRPVETQDSGHGFRPASDGGGYVGTDGQTFGDGAFVLLGVDQLRASNGTDPVYLDKGARHLLTTGGGGTTLGTHYRYSATGAVTVNLPSAVTNAQRVYEVKREGTSDVELTTTAGNLLCITVTQTAGTVTMGYNTDGTLTLVERGAAVRCISDGANWDCTSMGIGIDG